MKFDTKSFNEPTKEYRAKPFWSLNGKLEKAELKKQILNMKQMGFGGAFLHSRAGLKTEYMGKEWLDLMEYCVEILKENDMEAYLYDEDRWPSGTCGGYVTMTPEYRAKGMISKKLNALSKDELPENLLGIFAVRLGANQKLVSYRKIELNSTVQDGEEIYAFFWIEMAKDSFYNGYTYIDTLYKPACDKFIELTHEKYREVMGEKFGKEIVGIFTDEPNHGPLFTGFARKEEGKEDEVPYTPFLFDEFYKRMGYKLEERLPVIWFGKESDPFCKETYDYLEVVQQLFVENFAKPYYEWCEKYKLKFTGHILHEDSLAAQTTLCGSCMRFYEYMTYPGMDNLCSEDYKYNVPALVSSVAKQLGKEYCLDELYGITGWGMNLKDYKRIGDWQSFGGVTLRCPHLSWYTMEGEAKRDCPASIFHQSAWYKEYRLIEDYYARITYLMKNGEDVVSTAIINPVESTWGLTNKQTYATFFTVNDPLYQKLEEEYYDLYKGIKFHGQNADYIDEGLFAKYGGVEKGSFVCGLKKYDKVILNGNYHLRSTTLNALKEFMQGGGKVIVCGDTPSYLDGVKHDFTTDLEKAIKIPFDVEKLCALIKDEKMVIDGKNVMAVEKVFDGDKVILLLNQSKEKTDAAIKIKTDKKLVALDARKGDVKVISYAREEEYAVIRKTFGAFEELVLLCSDTIELPETTESSYTPYKTFDKFKFELTEDNMLVLDNPKLYVDGEFLCQKFVVFCDQEVRKRFGLELRSGEMVQPWFKEKFHPAQDKKYGKVALENDFNVETVPQSLKYMFEDTPTLELFVNGQKVDISKKQTTEIDNCFTVVDIPTELLIEGKNTLTVSFDFYEKTNIEGGFLLGNFGVKLGDIDSIVKLPDVLTTDDLTTQGLPYYGGGIKLYADLENGSYKAVTENLNVAVAKVNGNALAFVPFETEFEVADGKLTVEVILNRNNSFGVMIIDGKRVGVIKQNFDKFEILQGEQNG